MSKYKADRNRYYSCVGEYNPRTREVKNYFASHCSKKEADFFRLFREFKFRSNNPNGFIYASRTRPFPTI